jgi:hypothetical protein
MNPRVNTALFSKQPYACLILAGLFAAIGVMLLLDLLPASPNKPSAAHTQWILELMCACAACFFVYCAIVGLRAKSKP